jgi:hypothetical protein
MTPRRFEIADMSRTLALMADGERAETIVEMFKIAAAEFAVMVLEHTTTSTGHPLPADEGNPIRERLRDLDVDHRCEFLGSLFEAIMEEFARLIEDRAKH